MIVEVDNDAFSFKDGTRSSQEEEYKVKLVEIDIPIPSVSTFLASPNRLAYLIKI
jgi:hypothetical protein